ncbi:BTAD domain-containing putative transcriptional regulator [Herbidospora daliensis]|uniref:BTAD domain-containing putative transcriptional regulator n=1 Tax=Herbidospora daliensis TaxID=295585 RepID=UPI0007809F4A|nr:AAA family ATPase [Herbidospora daliensis]
MSVSASLTVQVLGPLRVWRDGVEVDTGPRQQSYLLALLAMGAGRPVSSAELLDLVWDDNLPTSAMNIVQKYVGTLRRLLEPDLPARAAGAYLHRRSGGYQFDVSDVALDLAEFRRLLGRARAATAAHRFDDAADAYEEALSRWRGSAGDGLPVTPAAWPLFTSVNRELLDACVEAAHATVPRGQGARILQPLRLAAWVAPLDETVQATLMTTLAASGQQAEALSVFETVRARLAGELGVDPGPALREAHRQVLGEPETAAAPPPEAGPRAATGGGADRIVGRQEELGLLRQAVDAAAAGRAGIVLVEGPPGVGKSRLLAEATAEAAANGALTFWGRCHDGEGAPAMWPWVQIAEALIAALPEDERARWTGALADLLHPAREAGAVSRPDAGAQFRLFGTVVALFGAAAARRPLVVVVDDLHWADQATLQLFARLAESLPDRSVLAGTLRDHAPTPGPHVRRMLASVARQDRHRRIVLGPLGPAEVAELVRLETGRSPSPGVARDIQARTEGNPLFVRELARFLAEANHLSDRAAAQDAVPSTVRDLVRDRTSRLDEEDRRLIEIAALMGRDVDARLLAGASGLDVPACLTRLEALEALGLVETASGVLVEWRFVHDLVREAVARSVSRVQASRLHLRIADALAQAGEPAERHAEALAHHLRLAGPLAEPDRKVRAILFAARIAARRSAYATAEKHLDAAVRIARDAGSPVLELAALTELTAVAGVHAGFVGAAMEHLDRAEEVARSLGREREATGFLFSRFLAHAQGLRLDAAARLARRLLDYGRRSADPVVQAGGHHAWGVHQWSSGDIGAACENLSRSDSLIRAERDAEPLRHRLQLTTPVMLALNTALHGDLTAARHLFDVVELDAGDDPYALSVWGSFAVTAAAVAGDPAWALRAADRSIDADPDFSFTFSGSYPRLARHWATAMSGGDPVAAAAEMEHVIETTLIDPPRSNLATWYALLAEIRLHAGDVPGATTALDRAETFIDTYGERYAEGLVLLIRAKALHAGGDLPAAVRTADRARTLSRERGAHLFAARAECLLAEVGGVQGRRPPGPIPGGRRLP